MSQIIGLKQLRQNVAGYAKQVQKGKTFIVVKQSKPLFKLAPVDEVDEYEDARGWRNVIDFTKIKKGGVDARVVLQALAELRNEQGKKGSKKASK